MVLCQATETATGTSHDIQALGLIVAQTPALFIVDGITGVGAYDIRMDEWKIDGLVAGSQKAVMLPTGMSYVSFSQKAWAVVEKCKTPRYYFDLRREQKANLNGETLFSTPVPIVRALDFVLTRIQQIGLQTHFQQLRRRADFTRAMAAQMNLQLYSKSPSDSVTALVIPTGLDGAALRGHLEKKYLVTVMGGQDQAKGKIIRIGHMGYITDLDMIETMFRLAQALKDQSYEINPEEIRKASEAWLHAHAVPTEKVQL